MDICDIASEQEEIARNASVFEVQNKPAAAEATGFCLECDAPIVPAVEGKRWCDKYCRDDWSRWHPEA